MRNERRNRQTSDSGEELTTGANIDCEHWSQIAAEWVAWARARNHDAFWAYRSSLLAFIGQGKGEALDVGCGEGRVSRVLKECGYRVTASDPVKQLVSAAKQANSADDYKVAPATSLPFQDNHFDLIMAYNVLMDVADVPNSLREIRRVLHASGTSLSRSCTPSRIAAVSLTRSRMPRLSSITPISAGNALRAWRSVTDCRCTSSDGRSPWKTIWPRW